MKQVDINGIAIGVVLGVPMTIYQNQGYPLTRHTGYVFGVVLFCWAVTRFVGMFWKRP